MEGLTYRDAFLSPDEEASLIERIESLPFHDVVIRGQAARRKVIHFGYDYDYERWSIRPTDAPPPFLEPFLVRAAAEAGLARQAIEQVMVARYARGATIGWHRDAPMFGSPVIGLSLGAACTMRFRRKSQTRWERVSLTLEPRSLYVLDGPARREWQHSIPPTPGLRYSVTLRTVRRHRDRAPAE